MRFSKYHGTGNDFVMIGDPEDALALTPALVAALCDRHLGVGGDGVIRVAPSTRADFFMDYWNADGEVAEMCGNGIRCLAKYAFERGLTDRTELDVDTRGGIKHLTLDVDGRRVASVRVDMGEPELERGRIPMVGPPDEVFIEQPFVVDGVTYRGTAVSMGNPHLVLFGAADLAALDLARIGPTVEYHADFPERTNVEFADVVDGVVEVRVWERGSGATMACGTGACASVVAANLAALVPRHAPVRFPGGELHVEWRADNHLVLTGPATFVFDGEMSDTWVEALREEAVR